MFLSTLTYLKIAGQLSAKVQTKISTVAHREHNKTVFIYLGDGCDWSNRSILFVSNRSYTAKFLTSRVSSPANDWMRMLKFIWPFPLLHNSRWFQLDLSKQTKIIVFPFFPNLLFTLYFSYMVNVASNDVRFGPYWIFIVWK